MKRRLAIKERLDKTTYYWMLLPGVVLTFLFSYLPMFGIILAFKNYKLVDGVWGSEWVGLENFKMFFSLPDSWTVLRNTIGYNFLFIGTGQFIAVALALLLNEVAKSKLCKVYQTIAIMPHFLSYVIIAYLVYSFLGSNGLVNTSILPALGIESINWYTEPKYWPFILFFVANWKEIGFSSVLYLAAIAGIDPSYYEAAQIDGASRWQQTKHITIPSLKTILTLKILMSISGILGGDFGLFYQVPMNSGSLLSTTNVLTTYIYRGMGRVSFTTAVGVFSSVVGLILLLISNALVRKLDDDSALF